MERNEDMNRAPGLIKAAEGHYMDWPAILGGSVVAVAVGSVFAGFGAALGLSTISAEPGAGSFNFMVIVTAVWIMVTLVSSYMTGGYIAGRMRRRIDTATADEITARDGINGLVVWGLGIVVSVLVLGSAVSTTLSTAGSLASSAGAAAGNVAAAAGSALGGAAQGALTAAGVMVPDAAKADPMAYVTSTLLRPAQVAPVTGGTGSATTTADLAAEAAGILGNVVATGAISDTERRYLESAVMANAGVTQPEAAAKVESAVTAAQAAGAKVAKAEADAKAAALQLEADAKTLAIKTAELARVSTILTAFLLAAGAMVAGAAAYVGAVRGGRHRDEARIFGGFAYRG